MQVTDDRFPAESGWNCDNYSNLFCYRTLHVSGIFFAHHQEFSTVHSTLVSFMQVTDDRFPAESGWNWANYSNFFCYRTLHVSGIFLAHHQEFSTVHSALVSFMQVFMTASKQSQDGTALQFHPDSAGKRSSVTCTKLTSAECTVENSWWWSKKMPETCRVL